MEDTLPLYYTVAEAAETLRVTPRTIYRYIDNGKLKATKTVGGEWRIPQEAIASFLNGVSDKEKPLTPEEMKRMYTLFGKSDPAQLRDFALWFKSNPDRDGEWTYNALIQTADHLEQEAQAGMNEALSL